MLSYLLEIGTVFTPNRPVAKTLFLNGAILGGAQPPVHLDEVRRRDTMTPFPTTTAMFASRPRD
jgi:hypothetical protein